MNFFFLVKVKFGSNPKKFYQNALPTLWFFQNETVKKNYFENRWRSTQSKFLLKDLNPEIESFDLLVNLKMFGWISSNPTTIKKQKNYNFL